MSPALPDGSLPDDRWSGKLVDTRPRQLLVFFVLAHELIFYLRRGTH